MVELDVVLSPNKKIRYSIFRKHTTAHRLVWHGVYCEYLLYKTELHHDCIVLVITFRHM